MRRDHPKVLLVEGKEERMTLPEYLEVLGVDWGPRGAEHVEIVEYDGVDELLAEGRIRAQVLASNREAVGVVVDADASMAGRWQTLRQRFADAGYTQVPVDLPQGGLNHAEPKLPRIGAWVMPNNVDPGMLESLLLAQFNGTPLHAHAVQAIADARTRGAPVRLVHEAKAQLHTLLAWQDPPGLQMHMAVRARVLSPVSTTLGTAFVGWFRQFYGL